MTFRSDMQAGPSYFRPGVRKEIYKPDFVILSLESKVIDYIFKWQKADPR